MPKIKSQSFYYAPELQKLANLHFKNTNIKIPKNGRIEKLFLLDT